jgi:hypothetical protein
MLQKESFVHQTDLDAIRDFAADDWSQVQAYASKRDPSVSEPNP